MLAIGCRKCNISIVMLYFQLCLFGTIHYSLSLSLSSSSTYCIIKIKFEKYVSSGKLIPHLGTTYMIHGHPYVYMLNVFIACYFNTPNDSCIYA